MEKKVIKNFLIYSMPNILSQALPFFILPITTKYLTIDDFGFIALFSVLLLPFKAIIQFGSAYVINARWYKINEIERKELIFLLLIINIIITFITIIVISFFYKIIFSFLAGDSWIKINDLYWVLIINVITLVPEEIFLNWIIIEKKAMLNTIINIVKIISGTLVMVIITVITKNYKLIIIGKVFTEFFIYLFEFFCLIRISKINFRKDILSDIFKISYPIFFQQFFANLKLQFDKLFINKLFGAEQLALYSFSDRFNVAFAQANRNYQKSYAPILLEQLAVNKIYYPGLKRTLMLWFISAYLFCSSILIFGRWFISIFTNNVYNNSYELVALFLCILLLQNIFLAENYVLIHFQKMNIIMISSLLESIISIVSCFILIPLLGAKGGIISVWLGRLTYYIIFFITKHRLLKKPFIEFIVLPYVIFFHIIIILKVFLKIRYLDILLIFSCLLLISDFFFRNRKYIIEKTVQLIKKLEIKLMKKNDKN